MDQLIRNRIQHELEEEAKKIFPGAVRRAVLLQHDDDPVIEPGELLLRLILITEVPEEGGELPKPTALVKASAMRQFRQVLSQRLPEVQRIEVMFEDASGHPLKGHLVSKTGDAEAVFGAGLLTPVMVRLRAPELEIVDTLISAGIAANRAEAIRWALARISERPAYAQLREHTRDIERLKTEF
jgi:hypothetical protein